MEKWLLLSWAEVSLRSQVPAVQEGSAQRSRVQGGAPPVSQTEHPKLDTIWFSKFCVSWKLLQDKRIKV
jgi:hypothetical protein